MTPHGSTSVKPSRMRPCEGTLTGFIAVLETSTHDGQETNIGDILMDDMRKYAIDVDYDYRLYPDEGETEEGETEEGETEEDKPG